MTECTDDRLRLLVERVERLEAEKKAISEDISAVYAEAKAVGYDVKIMRQIVRLRKMSPDDRREMDMLLDTYRAALGLDSHGQRDMFREHDGRPDPTQPAPSPLVTGDDLYTQACLAVVNNQKASTSWLQRQLQLGYNQTSNIMERLVKDEVIEGPSPVGTYIVKPGNLTELAAMFVAKDLDAHGITLSVSLPSKPRLSVVAETGGLMQ